MNNPPVKGSMIFNVRMGIVGYTVSVEALATIQTSLRRMLQTEAQKAILSTIELNIV